MTALLEFKQKIKNLYGRIEIYLLPVIKFAVALVYFMWINQNMGYMEQLNSIFVILILALVCSILPAGVTAFFGFVLMVGHAYALGLEAAGFMLVLVILVGILLLRFGGGQMSVLVCTPLSFALDIPVLLPIGSGLLGTAFAIFPASAGVIFYYFIRTLRGMTDMLRDKEVEPLEKLQKMADGLIQNRPMWMMVIAFVVVILLVNLIRTRSFDYAWRIAIIAGGVTFVLVMMLEGQFTEVKISVQTLLIQTGISVLAGIILEFFFFGGDYSRTERLQYEDDEYYYYVKAVPKAAVATSRRSIKKITGREERRGHDPVVSYESRDPGMRDRIQENAPAPPVDNGAAGIEQVDFEKKLEESLKDL